MNVGPKYVKILRGLEITSKAVLMRSQMQVMTKCKSCCLNKPLLISLGPIMYFCTEISKAMPLLHKSYVNLMFRDAKIT